MTVLTKKRGRKSAAEKRSAIKSVEGELEKLLKGVSFDFGKMDIKYLAPGSKKGFSILAGINRDIIPAQIIKLIKALCLMKMCIRPVVVSKISWIDGTPRYYIIDGQHLYNALMRLNCSIPYVVIDVHDKQDLVEKIAMANATSKSWTMGDYIKAWGSINEDYVTLNQIVKQYGIDVRSVVACYMNVYAKSASTIIKTGAFKIEDRKYGDRLLAQLQDCMSVCPKGSLWDKERFAVAALKVMRTNKFYNHAKFMSYLKLHKRELTMILSDQNEILNFLNKAFK